MSTQQAVTGPSPAPNTVGVVLVCWFWLAGAVLAAGVALATGGQLPDIAGAFALAAAPSLVGFALTPWLGSRWGAAAWLGVWTLAAAGLAVGSGGLGSSLVAGLAIAPALTSLLGRPWAPHAGAASLAGVAMAAWLGPQAPTLSLGLFPAAMGVVSIAMAALVMAMQPAAVHRSAIGAHRIAEVSHELRTPLTHILGFSEMIERQMFGEIGARYVEYAGLIRRSGNHLLSLVNDLLDLSKMEAGRYEIERELFDARAIVEEVVRQSTSSAEKKGIALGMVTPDTALLVRADPQALRRMLINTAGNAIKFTPDGGRVLVTAAALNGALVLETADTGPGIPEYERERLGRPFERGAGVARVEGAGLGLAMVRALAELHGGSLSLHAAPEGGALVRVVLPVLSAEE